MIRKHILAGSWYPEKPEKIRADMEKYLRSDREPVKVIGVLAPHAGWRYSGAVAGYVYASVVVPDVVVVLAPNHRGVGSRKAIWSKGLWTIPDAQVPVQEELSLLVMNYAGLENDTVAHQHEHSLEIHLPFLYYRNPGIKIVPVCLMGLELDSLQSIGRGIAKAVREFGKDVLIVASSDMSHYISVETARLLDGMAIEKMEKLDPEGLYKTVFENNISMCGVLPATVMLYSAIELGATEAKLIKYGTSGDTTGDYNEVVAYAGLIVK